MRKRLKIFITGGSFLVVLLIAAMLVPHYFGSSAYPLDYRTYIKKYANTFKLDPNFVAAVIFSESHFNPKATSPVGARGLMQIMPATGAGIAKAVGDKSFSATRLYEPKRNIKYGCYYLSTNLTRYKGNKTLVLIHYNGGPGAVIRYKRGSSIPRETQGYVRKVKSAERMYNQIYGRWWLLADSEKSKPRRLVPNYTNIKDFWKVLIAGGGTA